MDGAGGGVAFKKRKKRPPKTGNSVRNEHSVRDVDKKTNSVNAYVHPLDRDPVDAPSTSTLENYDFDASTPLTVGNVSQNLKRLPRTLQDVIGATNHFTVLGLSLPESDDLGHSLWDVDEKAIKRAFKIQSLNTHPDKNIAHQEDARKAFDKVKESYEVLFDEFKRDEYVRSFLAERKSQRTAEWTPKTDAELESALQAEVKRQKSISRLQKKHFESFQDKIKRGMKERQEKMKKSKALKKKQEQDLKAVIEGNSKPESKAAQKRAGKQKKADSSESEEETLSFKKRKKHGRNMFF